ncbi:trihelix transcription factor ASR3-like [Actinidia eriantha]|uniref:trihelix transcription factor ASR3-like n=1 Tax=Actinidia eriantha TaxID=165200 RepID=UPI002588753D|nr:trihelix transcription factor ASR3-like [Actinidia eriantha]XP_057475512.1 trihelix transcription factor ASR3-like [Actinidia eriantha]XP_057475513.1 trihelix transcription factor ASR3-like [Actinidia eriantha]XP_057475514.1 trihelix transcription factor ASR3-like [Actinidia eriantha]
MASSEEERGGGGRQSHRTRSKAAPDWTVHETLTLVSEIAAVESECRKTVSSFQKWKIVAENCNATGVNRTLNQCRRKWDSLLTHYKKIKNWESSSSSELESYWSLDRETRRGLGFPEEFDSDVFKAIDDHLKDKDDGSDTETDRDNDPEALADEVDVLVPVCSGFKKQRRHMMHQKQDDQERLRPQKCSTNKNVMPEQRSAEEKAKPLKRRKDEKIMLENSSIESKEQILFAKLQENAELITSILKGNLDENVDYVLADLKNVDAPRTAFTRRQGDKIITCLGNLGDTLDQLYDIFQGCS